MTLKKRFLYGGTGLVALVVLAAVVGLFSMQDSARGSHGPQHPVNQYAAKFTCGPIASPADPTKALAPGMYNTAVNIHNPNNFPVTIQKKAVVAITEPGQGRPSARQTHTLLPDAAMDVDCFEIGLLLGPPNPAWDVCPLNPAGVISDFCKGYLIIEAATQTATGGSVPQQLDVTDILTVKEEDGIWKDYTFNLYCTLPAVQCPNAAAIRYSVLTGTYQNGGLIDMNLPVRPPAPPCYNDVLLPCKLYDTDSEIRNGLFAYCTSVGGVNCNNFLGVPAPQLYVQFKEADYATDSRDVSLDFEFVSPKRVTYPCWPKGVPGCP